MKGDLRVLTQWRGSDCSGESMDGRLWGSLQHHIDLEMVYVRLPIWDFFRLRLVCKEWNRLASDREFLERTIPRAIPSLNFVIARGKQWGHGSSRLRTRSWLLYYESWAKQWSWTRLPPWDYEVGGLLCNDSMMFVFNIHTRVFHKLPSLPQHKLSSLLGITVAGSAAGQYNFQVILGDVFLRTWIYSSDSGCWKNSERKISHISYYGTHQGHSNRTCATSDSILYVCQPIIFQASDYTNFYTYDLVQGEWDSHSVGVDTRTMVNFDIGVWQSRVFLFGFEVKCKRPIVKAWELRSKILPGENPDWVLFDQMPSDLCEWMLVGEISIDLIRDHNQVNTQTRFTDKYVLVYALVESESVFDQVVLYNLEKKTWEKVQLPAPLPPPGLASRLHSGMGKGEYFKVMRISHS